MLHLNLLSTGPPNWGRLEESTHSYIRYACWSALPAQITNYFLKLLQNCPLTQPAIIFTSTTTPTAKDGHSLACWFLTFSHMGPSRECLLLLPISCMCPHCTWPPGRLDYISWERLGRGAILATIGKPSSVLDASFKCACFSGTDAPSF